MIALDAVVALRLISGDVCEEVFAPPPRQTVSEWADENRMLPSTSAEPGRFRTDRIPYLRKIQDTLGDELVREVVFAKPSQVAGTTAGENFIGSLMDQAPCAILEVWPTEKLMRAWSTKRLRPMLEDTDCLAAKFPRSGRRDSKDSIGSKEFPGGYLQLLTAKSTADLRAHSARVAVAEEIDEWEGDIGEQGDPLELLRARGRTFWNFKLYMVSTPTLAGLSRIWSELESSTWEEYWVPCPHCDHVQRLVWQDETGAYRLICDKDANGELIPETAKYACESCGVLIEERYKQQMLERGEWRARFPGRTKVGFHINTLYSPLCPWSEIIAGWMRAQHSSAKMQTFWNTMLGLPYEAKGEQIDAHFLASRVGPYGRTPNRPWDLPIGVGLLTAFADVQGDRLELFVWGWGAREVSWFIEWVILEGDPGLAEVWRRLDEELLRPRVHERGAKLRIAACAVDANYQSESVHRFCETRSGRHIIPTIGRDGRGRPLLMAPGQRPTKFKRTGREKRPSYTVGVDSGKDKLYSRLRLTLREDGSAPPEYVHFPETVDPVFFDQLTAEKLVTGYIKKRPVRKWVLPDGRRNEALDAAVGAMAALTHLGTGVIAKLGQLAEELTAAGTGSTAAAAPAPQRRMRSRGVEGW